MPTQNTTVKQRRKEARQAFGRMVRRWREQNGWSQYTGEAWAKESGFDLLSHAGLSTLENGQTATPQWATFGHFAEMNRRLAAQDFTGVKKHELLALLHEARPMVDDDGVLLEEEALFGIHAGTRLVPTSYWVPPEGGAPTITDAEAIQLCEAWRQLVRNEAARRGTGLVSCLNDLGSLVPEPHRVLLQEVLVGASNYSACELLQLWNGKDLLPQVWIEIWIAGPRQLPPSGGGAMIASLTGR